jgi:hypothetical protein
VCNTPDDIIHLVKTGMSGTDAPVTASGMPVATVRTASGGISGFVVKSGASLVLVDGNFANPVTLGTFAAPIGVAVALPVGTTEGYPTGQLFVVDGNIVYVNYATPSVSASLFAIPDWTPTKEAAIFAASPTSLYWAINTPAAGGVAASARLYVMPANGAAAPTVIDSEAGYIATLVFPVQGANVIWGVEDPTYTIRTLGAGGAPTTLISSTDNDGTFIATATSVYYETWVGTTNTSTLQVTRSGTQSGIVGVNGTVIEAPLANSTFVNGGEQLPWPDDTTTTSTAYQTVFQLQGLSPVTVMDSSTGYSYTEDGIGGASLIAIDVGSNQVGAMLGVLPASSATAMNGTFRGSADTGFLEASNPLSTEDPSTRDLYLLDSQVSNSLLLLTQNL